MPSQRMDPAGVPVTLDGLELIEAERGIESEKVEASGWPLPGPSSIDRSKDPLGVDVAIQRDQDKKEQDTNDAEAEISVRTKQNERS